MVGELDAGMVARCRRGDPAALRVLIERYQDRVHGLCYAMAGGADADDLTQETFVRVLRAIAKFDGDGAATLGTWILTIARRQCQDRVRSARFRHEIAVDAVEAVSERLPPDEALDEARRDQRLRAAVARLPEEQRAAMALRAWGELEYEEIAAVEGVPIGTVRSRLSRARASLSRMLGNDVQVVEAEVVANDEEWRHAVDE